MQFTDVLKNVFNYTAFNFLEVVTAASTFGLFILTYFIAKYAKGAYEENKKASEMAKAVQEKSKEEFEESKKNFAREQFENRFFEMLKIYRDNVQEMEYVSPDKEHKTIIKGRKVFVNINREFIRLFKQLEVNENVERNIGEEKLVGITWLTIFFGLGNEGDDMLRTVFIKYKVNIDFPKLNSYILNTLITETAEYDTKIRKYGGHQIRLGHYYRHFYQAVTYVHTQKILTKFEKHSYVKMLRAQMSTYEQAIFFYNSLSPLGKIWEFAKRDVNYILNANCTKEDLLVTEYKLIKNIPEDFTSSINPKDYFRLLKFEYEEIYA